MKGNRCDRCDRCGLRHRPISVCRFGAVDLTDPGPRAKRQGGPVATSTLYRIATGSERATEKINRRVALELMRRKVPVPTGSRNAADALLTLRKNRLKGD